MFDITKSLNDNWDKIDEYVYGQEATRQENESKRQENENTRQIQEDNRQSQEEVRENNETQRETNEQAREEYIKQLKEQVLNGEVGNGIESYELVEGNHKAGTFDIYRITFTDGTTKDIQVYNGRDGNGAGDMIKATYDTNDNGIVDNAEKVNNHTVETDVPENVVFIYAKDKEKIDNMEKAIRGTRAKVVLDKRIEWDTDWTIPVSYIVASNDLEVRYEGCPCILNEHYREVGEPGTSSNKIQLVEDMTGDIGEIWEFVKRG